MLCLFDIDGTLVDTCGAGMEALVQTTRHFFGDSGPELDLAGATDLGIIHELHQYFAAEVNQDRIEAYFIYYEDRLQCLLNGGSHEGRALPGALELVERLHSLEDVTLGLLTGNTETGAYIKCRHFGFGDYFKFGAFGSDHHDRNQLGPLAMQRAIDHSGQLHHPDRTWVIGDTPKDIACAHAFGARCLAVASGHFTKDQLVKFGANAVVGRLDEAMGILQEGR